MPLPAAAVAAIPVVGKLLGGIFGGSSSKKRDERNFKNEVKMFNMANAYNAPIRQRERLVEAGLNPALMYGGSSISNTSSTPHVSASEQTGVFDGVGEGISQAMQAYVDYTMMDKQKELIDANIAQKAQQVVTSQADVRLKDYMLNTKLPADLGYTQAKTAESMFNLDKSKSFMPSQLQALEADVDLKKASFANTNLRNKGLALDNWAKEVNNANLPEKVKYELAMLQQKVVSEIMNQEFMADRGHQVRKQTIGTILDNAVKEFDLKALTGSRGMRYLEQLRRILSNK